MSFPRKLELRDNFRKERKTRMAPSIESLRLFRSRVHELIFFSLSSPFFLRRHFTDIDIESILFSSLLFSSFVWPVNFLLEILFEHFFARNMLPYPRESFPRARIYEPDLLMLFAFILYCFFSRPIGKGDFDDGW